MEEPIQNIDQIDIIGQRKDGGIDLIITVSSFLDNTERNDYLLRTKIQSYIDAIFSDSWVEKYGQDNSQIFIKATTMPHQEMLNLIGAFKNYLKQYNVNLWLEVA